MTQKIDLTIRQDYLNPFASPDNPRLSPDLVDYLSDCAWYHHELSLQISCPEDERERLQHAIGNTFAEMSERVTGQINIRRLEALALLVLAISLASSALALGIQGTIPKGIVTVTAWMLVWRAAEIFFLDIRSLRRDRHKYQRIASAPRHFV